MIAFIGLMWVPECWWKSVFMIVGRGDDKKLKKGLSFVIMIYDIVLRRLFYGKDCKGYCNSIA